MNQLSNDPLHSESPEIAKQVNKAIAYACRLLGVREYSRKMIRGKLADKGYDAEIASQVIEFLIENGWQSDERFCESFIRGRAAKGQGLKRIQFELTQKGIDEMMVQTVLESLAIDFQAVCDSVAAKKVAIVKDIRDIKKRLKVERFLQYRGFLNSEIRKTMDKQIKVMGETTGEHVE